MSLQETVEDYLGVALIKPGDSVIVRMKVFLVILKMIKVILIHESERTNLGGTTVI